MKFLEKKGILKVIWGINQEKIIEEIDLDNALKEYLEKYI